MDAKCRWHSDRLDGALSFRELLGQTKVMQIRQAAQYMQTSADLRVVHFWVSF